MAEYKDGELFVYTNGDRWELGKVKRPNNDGSGYFCWYSTGDTAANTPVECMHKLANAGWSRIEGEFDGVRDDDRGDMDTVEWGNHIISLVSDGLSKCASTDEQVVIAAYMMEHLKAYAEAVLARRYSEDFKKVEEG